MVDIISLLASVGATIATQHHQKIIDFFKTSRTKEEIQKEILPLLKIVDSECDNQGILNILTEGGLEIRNSKLINKGITNIVSNKNGVELNLINTKKLSPGDTIGSISFTTDGIILDSTNSEE